MLIRMYDYDLLFHFQVHWPPVSNCEQSLKMQDGGILCQLSTFILLCSKAVSQVPSRSIFVKPNLKFSSKKLTTDDVMKTVRNQSSLTDLAYFGRINV